MTPSARLQASIEILDLVIDAAKDNGAAADTIIAGWFKTRRFAGSKDRRAVRELVYNAIRAFGTRPHSGRAAMLGMGKELRPLFDGSPYGPWDFKPGEAVAGPSPAAEASAGERTAARASAAPAGEPAPRAISRSSAGMPASRSAAR